MKNGKQTLHGKFFLFCFVNKKKDNSPKTCAPKQSLSWVIYLLSIQHRGTVALFNMPTTQALILN